jgi:hypothetical protein
MIVEVFTILAGCPSRLCLLSRPRPRQLFDQIWTKPHHRLTCVHSGSGENLNSIVNTWGDFRLNSSSRSHELQFIWTWILSVSISHSVVVAASSSAISYSATCDSPSLVFLCTLNLVGLRKALLVWGVLSWYAFLGVCLADYGDLALELNQKASPGSHNLKISVWPAQRLYFADAANCRVKSQIAVRILRLCWSSSSLLPSSSHFGNVYQQN